MGLGAFPAPHEQWLGMLGMHGTRTANYAMDEADLIVCDRRPLRRPHHRQALGVRAAGEVRPHRRRPGRDLQERPRPHPDRRRRQADVLPKLTREYRALEARSRRGSPSGGRGSASWQTAAPAPLRGQPRLRDQAAADGRGDVRGDRGRRDRHLRRRPAPDVGRAVLPLREAAAVDQLRRAGDDGLRAAGGDRRQGRAARTRPSSASPATAAW